MPTIEEWQWDDNNLSKLRREGLSRKVVLQISREAPRFKPNKKNRTASHLMIGPDRGGAMWVIPILEPEPELNPNVWRAITGWPAERSDEKWYERSK